MTPPLIWLIWFINGLLAVLYTLLDNVLIFLLFPPLIWLAVTAITEQRPWVAAMGVLAPDFCSKADQMRFLLTYLNTKRLTPRDRKWLRRVQAKSDMFREAEVERLRRGKVFDPPLSLFTETAAE